MRPRRAACSKVRVAVAAYDKGVSVAVQTLYGCPLQSRGNYRSSIQWATADNGWPSFIKSSSSPSLAGAYSLMWKLGCGKLPPP